MGNGIVHTESNFGRIWSSAGVLRCSLQWGNLRNPHPMFAWLLTFVRSYPTKLRNRTKLRKK